MAMQSRRVTNSVKLDDKTSAIARVLSPRSKLSAILTGQRVVVARTRESVAVDSKPQLRQPPLRTPPQEQQQLQKQQPLSSPRRQQQQPSPSPRRQQQQQPLTNSRRQPPQQERASSPRHSEAAINAGIVRAVAAQTYPRVRKNTNCAPVDASLWRRPRPSPRESPRFPKSKGPSYSAGLAHQRQLQAYEVAKHELDGGTGGSSGEDANGSARCTTCGECKDLRCANCCPGLGRTCGCSDAVTDVHGAEISDQRRTIDSSCCTVCTICLSEHANIQNAKLALEQPVQPDDATTSALIPRLDLRCLGRHQSGNIVSDSSSGSASNESLPQIVLHKASERGGKGKPEIPVLDLHSLKGSKEGKGSAPPLPQKGSQKGSQKGQQKGPPGVKGKGKASPIEPRKPVVTPRSNVRKLYWNSFQIDDSGASTVWHAIDKDGTVAVSTDELDQLFAIEGGALNVSTHDLESIKASPRPQRIRKIQVLDEPRRRQVGVLLARLPGLAVTYDALAKMDSRLTREHIELLLNNLPSELEIQLLQAEEKARIISPDSCVWDAAEEFLLGLIHVPEYELRLRLSEYEHTFRERLDDITRIQRIIMNGCNAIRHSHGVQRLLGAILATGNYLNGGTPRGRADGFAIDTLTMLGTVKSSQPSSPTGTLIDYVAQQVESLEPATLLELFAPKGAADHIIAAGRYKMEDVNEELRTLVVKTRGMLRLAAKGRDSGDGVFVQHSEIIALCAAEVEELQCRHSELETLFSELCTWFKMDEGQDRRSSDILFSTWATFLRELGGARTRHRERTLSPLPLFRRGHRRSISGTQAPTTLSPRMPTDRRRRPSCPSLTLFVQQEASSPRRAVRDRPQERGRRPSCPPLHLRRGEAESRDDPEDAVSPSAAGGGDSTTSAAAAGDAARAAASTYVLEVLVPTCARLAERAMGAEAASRLVSRWISRGLGASGAGADAAAAPADRGPDGVRQACAEGDLERTAERERECAVAARRLVSTWVTKGLVAASSGGETARAGEASATSPSCSPDPPGHADAARTAARRLVTSCVVSALGGAPAAAGAADADGEHNALVARRLVARCVDSAAGHAEQEREHAALVSRRLVAGWVAGALARQGDA